MSELDTRTLRKIRVAISIFIAGLILSGVTSFALHTELNWLVSMRGPNAASGFDQWLRTVRDGLAATHEKYPWLAYGTDWLAFAHIVIALFFIGPLVDPVRNVWVIYAGLAACVLVVPLALICGPIRHVPLGWRLIDCSFGILGAIPLLYVLRLKGRLRNYE
ncbi:MAG TPA: hypothetical protein VFC26_12675 [Verrucomicrobiae bacterium]|nr:hypothetical protein [Verrucomicrobiae bacterium]